MANAAASSSDCDLKGDMLDSPRRMVIDTDDSLDDQNQRKGRLNLVQRATAYAPGQPSAPITGNRARRKDDAKYRANSMMKLKVLNVLSKKVKKLERKHECLRKSWDQMMKQQSDDRVREQLQSLKSSLIIDNASKNQLISFVSDMMVCFKERDDLKKENFEFKREIDELKRMIDWDSADQ